MADARRDGFKKRFGKRVLLPGAIILLMTGLLCGAGLIAAGRGTDKMSLMAQQLEVMRATSLGMGDLTLAQQSIGLCDQCISKAKAFSPDQRWFDENVSSPLFDIYGVDETYILDGQDRPIYASRQGRQVSPAAYGQARPAVEHFVSLSRGRIKRPSGRSNLNERLPGSPPQPLVFPPHPGFSDKSTTLFPAVRTTPNVVHATDMVRVGNRVAIISAMPMAHVQRDDQDSTAHAPVLVNLRYLNTQFLLEVSQQNYLREPRLSDSPHLAKGETSTPLMNTDGVPLTNIVWKPMLRGSEVIRGLLIPAASVFGVISILLLLLALRIRTFMRRDDEHFKVLHRSEERLRLIQDATGMADFETNAGGLSVCSPRFFAQAGLPAGDGTIDFPTWISCVHSDDRDHLAFEVQQALVDKNEFSCEFRIIHAETGETRWISSRTKVLRDATGKLLSTIGAHLDVTERKAAQAALVESEERFRLAADVAGLGIWDYDPATGKRQWSERLLAILGLSNDTEPSMELATATVHPDDRAAFKEHLQELLHGEKPGKFEISFRICRATDQAERWLTMNGSRAYSMPSGSGRLIVTVRDSTAEVKAGELAQWSANHDPLTGLANRRLFQLKLEQALEEARETRRCAGLLLLDLDHFKQINDTLGHHAGDVLLKMFAERLQSIMRSEDTISRFGGDEFAIIISRLDRPERLAEVSRSILDRLREPFVHEGRVLDCRASIGASIFPDHGDTPEELLKNADMALYSAKHAGRGVSISFEPNLRADAQRRSSMVQLGRNAVRHDRVIPYYQPKLDLIDGSIAGFEALLRWRGPNGSIHQPSTIEAAFEDLEVAAEISDRMIERTIDDIRTWLDRGVQFGHVAVNAAAAEFRQDNFAERLLNRLNAANIPSRYFQLEVTETVFLGRGAEFVHRALGLLSSAGVKIALDDFGTGYASLRHLKEFPVDIMKIDRSFVKNMQNDVSDEAIIRAVINLGRNLGIKVVAEGVETEVQADQLIALGCDFGQGFLFSKAVPAARVPALASLQKHVATRASQRRPTLQLVTARR